MTTIKDSLNPYDRTAIRQRLRIELEQKLKAQKKMRHLMEFVLITIFTVTIAIASVSDGNLDNRPPTMSETQNLHSSINAVRVSSNEARPETRN